MLKNRGTATVRFETKFIKITNTKNNGKSGQDIETTTATSIMKGKKTNDIHVQGYCTLEQYCGAYIQNVINVNIKNKNWKGEGLAKAISN